MNDDWKTIDSAPRNKPIELVDMSRPNFKHIGIAVTDLRYKYGGYWQCDRRRWPFGGPTHWRTT